MTLFGRNDMFILKSKFLSAPQISGTNDEGGLFGASMQVQAPNHLMLIWTKAMVVSDKEKPQ